MRARRSIIIFIAQIAVAGAEPGVWLPLDGYNTQYVDYRAPGMVKSLSYTGGRTDDPFYHFPVHDSGKHPLLSGRVQLGAETGDPLLNSLTDTRSFPNRDHRSYLGGEFRHPSLPLSCAGRYRYIDDYTDRFDSLWCRSRSVTGIDMYHSNKGVDYEKIAMVRWAGERLDAGARVNPYVRWHATPLFFSPLLEEGIAVDGRVRALPTDRCTIESSYRFTRSQWYYDHMHGERFTDNVSENSLEYQWSPRVLVRAEINYSSLHHPELACGIGAGYADSLLELGGILYGYSDGEVSGSVHAALSCCNAVRCSTSVSREYVPGERGYTFLQNDTVVTYVPRNIAGISWLGDVKWSGNGMLPVELEGWVFHTTDPVEALLHTGNDTIRIEKRTSKRLVRTFAGCSGHADVVRGGFHLSLRTGVLLPFGEKQKVHLYCASFADAECEFASPGDNPMRFGISLHYNSTPHLSYAVTGDDNTYNRRTLYGEEWFSGSMKLRIPFLCLPLGSLFSGTAFILDAGPLSFGGKRRVQAHPGGNRIGPEIYAGFEGTIR